MPTAVKRCMQVGRTYSMYCKKWCEGITVVQRGRGYPRGSYKLLHQSIRATLRWQKCLLVTRSSSLLRLVPDPIEFMIKPWWVRCGYLRRQTETYRDLAWKSLKVASWASSLVKPYATLGCHTNRYVVTSTCSSLSNLFHWFGQKQQVSSWKQS